MRHARLFVPKPSNRPEIRAALRGLFTFTRFGFTHDWRHVHETTSDDLKGIRGGSELLQILRVSSPLVEPRQFLGGPIDIVGVGMTHQPLLALKDNGLDLESVSVIGVGMGGMAIFSTHGLNRYGTPLLLRAIEKGITHETAHAIGLNHCSNDGCLMQGPSNSDFIQRVADMELAFCGTCSEKLRIQYL